LPEQEWITLQFEVSEVDLEVFQPKLQSLARAHTRPIEYADRDIYICQGKLVNLQSSQQPFAICTYPIGFVKHPNGIENMPGGKERLVRDGFSEKVIFRIDLCTFGLDSIFMHTQNITMQDIRHLVPQVLHCRFECIQMCKLVGTVQKIEVIPLT
jgi:hypothetical protein